ncbi:MAG: MFS transporter [Acidimicrobiia bacterium]
MTAGGPRLDRTNTILLLNRFLSSTASVGVVTALGKQVYDLTGRELDLGFLGLAEFAPAALLVLVTGVVADRHDRRKVVSISLTGEALAVLALAWYAWSGNRSVWPIFLIVLWFGVTRAFVNPASRAMPADLVPAEHLPWLIPRMSGMWQTAAIVGPVFAGVLYAVEPYLAFVVMAGFIGLSAFTVLLLPARPVSGPAHEITSPLEEALIEPVEGHGAAAESPRATINHALEGLRLIRRQPILLGAITLDLFAVLFGGAVALLPAIAEDRLGVGAVGLGWLRAAGGIGAALVTLVLALKPLQRMIGRVLLVSVALFGVFTIVLGFTRNFAIAFVALAALAGADAVSVFIRSTLVPLATPDHMRGRVMAVEMVFVGASNELGAFESGVVGQALGITGAIVSGGIATLVVAGLWWLLFPPLRNIDRFPDRPVDDIVTRASNQVDIATDPAGSAAT